MAATGKIAHVKQKFYERVEAMAATLGVGAAYPNSAFVPGEDWYIEAKVFPNGPRGQGLSSGRLDQGLLVVSGVFPKNTGDIEPSNIAATIMSWFPRGLNLHSGGHKISIVMEPFEGVALTRNDRYLIPITIEWVS
jgi:hypothetical protein